ncbi:hypothetical protein FJY70_05685, partial [candidate division WOR-3 bacterium]|nr:hypothetical protein [candidate division WOR-3 bacterium]
TAGFPPRAPGRLDRLALAQTREAVKQADLIIAVFDASRPYGRADREVVDSIRARPAVWVLNKTDLAIRFDERVVAGPAKWVPVSCRRGSGLPRLRSCLARMLSPGLPRLALNPRHLQALEACREALVRGRAAPNLETAALEVTAAIDMLNQIDAPAAPPEILDRVFARFCVGK